MLPVLISPTTRPRATCANLLSLLVLSVRSASVATSTTLEVCDSTFGLIEALRAEQRAHGLLPDERRIVLNPGQGSSGTQTCAAVLARNLA